MNLFFKEGDLYVDHDVKCFKTFRFFHENFDCYCGLEPPYQSVLSSSISACNHVIGARSGQPILNKTMENVTTYWNELTLAYPKNEPEPAIYRLVQRTFAAFDNVVKEKSGAQGTNDIGSPAAYFNQIDDDEGFYAHHYYASTWFNAEISFERNVSRFLVVISRKNNPVLLFNAVILIAHFALFSGLFFQYCSIKGKRFVVSNKTDQTIRHNGEPYKGCENELLRSA